MARRAPSAPRSSASWIGSAGCVADDNQAASSSSAARTSAPARASASAGEEAHLHVVGALVYHRPGDVVGHEVLATRERVAQVLERRFLVHCLPPGDGVVPDSMYGSRVWRLRLPTRDRRVGSPGRGYPENFSIRASR